MGILYYMYLIGIFDLPARLFPEIYFADYYLAYSDVSLMCFKDDFLISICFSKLPL